jgi:polar amino acid transport system substrate-binding protein
MIAKIAVARHRACFSGRASGRDARRSRATLKGTILVLRVLRLTIAGLLLAGAAALADPPVIPNLWDSRERLTKPDLSGVQRIRFLTTVDFPPFNFVDPAGRLGGFHIDLIRAICRELDVTARCQVQALPWDELENALAAGEGEAIIAGIAVTDGNRERLVFSRPYLKFPARFVTTRSATLEEPLRETLAGRRVGVVRSSAHETMLGAYFPAAVAVPFDSQEAMLSALRSGEIEAAFGDGMRLGFWLASADAQGCCGFAGGPYLAPEYFGAGLAIAVAPDKARLAAAFDFAMQKLNADGVFAELYLRYFPVGFF